jgi:hypothetical protein
MSDTISTPARPVSLVTIVFVFALFAAFLLVVRYFYTPTSLAPQVVAPENLTKDLEWKATRESRRATLAELRDGQIKQGAGYGWVDQKTGVVRLPIERAMELTARDFAAKQPVREVRDLPDNSRAKL